MWSSPASSSTPPWRAEPAELPCFSASPLRSTPGPLPYHIAKTPSYLAPGNRLSCWLPHTAVAAQLLVDRRLETDVVLSMKRLALHSAWSNPPKGEPRYPEIKQAVLSPAARVALALHQRQTHQRLGPGQIDASLVERIFVVECDRRQRHCHRDLPKPPLSFDKHVVFSDWFLNERRNPVAKRKRTGVPALHSGARCHSPRPQRHDRHRNAPRRIAAWQRQE